MPYNFLFGQKQHEMFWLRNCSQLLLNKHGFIQDILFVRGGGKHLGDLLKHSHIREHQACLTEIMTSLIQTVGANKLGLSEVRI